MSKMIKIVHSPFNPSMEVVEDIIVSISVPYSDNNVTLEINPNVQDFKENMDSENIQVRQVTVTTSTDQTRRLNFDFNNNKSHRFNIEGKEYEIELMNIGKENIQGQDFPFFEFNVSV